MFEIRFHGRGGQGSVIASEILSKAIFSEGKDVQSFPFFGVERRGAPVQAYTRIDDKPIRVKTNIYTPDCVVVLDPSLLKSQNVTAGLKEGGYLLINTEKKPEDIAIAFNGLIATVDATDIALKFGLGSKSAPIVNTAILGALAKVTGLVRIDSLTTAIGDSVPSKPEANSAAAKEAFERVLIRRMAA
jgi:2-oxoacid:acceptor oxidoreductase gamma subunit (pyruvate/2-ketoisovalerate family)